MLFAVGLEDCCIVLHTIWVSFFTSFQLTSNDIFDIRSPTKDPYQLLIYIILRTDIKLVFTGEVFVPNKSSAIKVRYSMFC